VRSAVQSRWQPEDRCVVLLKIGSRKARARQQLAVPVSHRHGQHELSRGSPPRGKERRGLGVAAGDTRLRNSGGQLSTQREERVGRGWLRQLIGAERADPDAVVDHDGVGERRREGHRAPFICRTPDGVQRERPQQLESGTAIEATDAQGELAELFEKLAPTQACLLCRALRPDVPRPSELSQRRREALRPAARGSPALA